MPVISPPRHHRHVRAHLRPPAAIFTNALFPVALRLLSGTANPFPSSSPTKPPLPPRPSSAANSTDANVHVGPAAVVIVVAGLVSRRRSGRSGPTTILLFDAARRAPLLANAPPPLRLRVGLSLSGSASSAARRPLSPSSCPSSPSSSSLPDPRPPWWSVAAAPARPPRRRGRWCSPPTSTPLPWYLTLLLRLLMERPEGALGPGGDLGLLLVPAPAGALARRLLPAQAATLLLVPWVTMVV